MGQKIKSHAIWVSMKKVFLRVVIRCTLLIFYIHTIILTANQKIGRTSFAPALHSELIQAKYTSNIQNNKNVQTIRGLKMVVF